MADRASLEAAVIAAARFYVTALDAGYAGFLAQADLRQAMLALDAAPVEPAAPAVRWLVRLGAVPQVFAVYPYPQRTPRHVADFANLDDARRAADAVNAARALDAAPVEPAAPSPTGEVSPAAPEDVALGCVHGRRVGVPCPHCLGFAFSSAAAAKEGK